MDFGKVASIEEIDFLLPADNPATGKVLAGKEKALKAYAGCAKWNKTDLKNFYPKGTKDELTYYAQQFNSIELNATHYKMPTAEQVVAWKDKTPDGFKFCPKITNSISHYKRLLNVKELTESFADAVSHFEEKLGPVFLQVHDRFTPNEFAKLQTFIEEFPKGIPLAIEVRNEQWFSDKAVWEAYCTLLEKNNATNIIVDTAGRRDLLHMRLTTPVAFIRFVGCNHDEVDYRRLDDWVKRIKKWHKAGLKELYFFMHQNREVSSPLFAAYFIEELNKALKLSLKVPDLPGKIQ